MDDETRRTWAGVFVTLGATLLAGCALRWLVWQDDHVDGARHPEVMWTLGFLGLAFVLAAAKLMKAIWDRRAQTPAEEPDRDDWQDG